MQLSDDVPRVKQATDLVDLVGTFVPLQRSGSNLRALCPFHEEKTPSFYVFPQSQLFRCFGCNAAGDSISFVQRFQNLGFRDALEWLAERAGVTLSRGAAREGSGAQRKSIYKALDSACAYFEANLKRAPAPLLAELDRRGLHAANRAKWRIGLSPSGWQTLHERLVDEGHPPDLQLAAGLVKRQESGRIHDRFRERIMFPITDVLGRVVAFGARLLPGRKEGEEHGPKYLNSAENEFFQKRKILYGLDKFPRSQQNEGVPEPVVVMEGYTDVILAHEAGMRRAVATLGTALGRDHALELRRHSPRVLLLYDGDEAGLRASERGVGVLLEEGLEVRVAALPNEMDPADYVLAHGGERFLAEVGQGVEFLEFLGARIRARGAGLASPEERARACDEVLGYVVKIDSPVQRELWVRRIASWFSVSESRVAERLARMAAEASRAAANRSRFAPAPTAGSDSPAAAAPGGESQESAPQLSEAARAAAEQLLGGILRAPAAGSIVLENGFEARRLVDPRFVAILEAIVRVAERGIDPDVHAVTEELGEVAWRTLPATLLTSAPENAEDAVLNAIAYFERVSIEAEIRTLRERLRGIDSRKDPEDAMAVQRRLAELLRRLHAGCRPTRNPAPRLEAAAEPFPEVETTPDTAPLPVEVSHEEEGAIPMEGGFGLEAPFENDGLS